MTCLQCGTPHHPHFDARTVEGPRWCGRGQHTWPLLPKAGDRACVPCQEQGADRQAANMTHSTEELNGEMGAWLPGVIMGDTGQQDAWFPSPNPLLPKGSRALCT